MPEIVVAPDGVTVRSELKLTRAQLEELVRAIDAERQKLHGAGDDPAGANP